MLNKLLTASRSSLTVTDIALFLRQLATLIQAGVPILTSCELLEKCQIKTVCRTLINTIKKELLSGKTFYESLFHTPIDPFTRQLIRIGEYTGKLDQLLLLIADHQEKNLAFRKKMKKLLFYPCIVIVVATLVSLSMFIFIIPRFAVLFEQSQSTLPLMTRGIFMISGFLNEHLLFLFMLFLLCLTMFFLPLGVWIRKKVFHLITQLPLIHTYLQKIILARFSRNLAITFSSGIPLNEALKLSAHAPSHPDFMNNVAKLHYKLNTGLSLHHAMAALPYFPILMIQMIKIGEETGMLDAMLNKLADFIESEIDHLIQQCSQLLEPLIMLILGVLIGGLVIGLYLPLFKLGSVF